ncbi:hypothetical protein [Oscillibacter sp.]|uniref:hypothetical protein n=1 Tax=Oscillibacter sp. TaxID=1945593 RepID=UPI00289A4036|nr:hypothetical protein [Oscillibacter sp.]
MTALEKMQTWIATFPGYDILSHFHVDYTDKAPPNGGIYPSGLVEVERRRDIVGNTTVTNQYNFAIYCVFLKAIGDDEGATINAGWVSDFQEWVQEQSVTGAAPTFGDEPRTERIMAQNGMLYDTDEEGTTAMYMVQMSVQFKKKFEGRNKWLT